jgi:amidase
LRSAGRRSWGIFFHEIWDAHQELVQTHRDGVGPDIAQAMALAEGINAGGDDTRSPFVAMRRSLADLLGQAEVLALPTLPIFPPRRDTITADSLFATCIEITKHVVPFNVAGAPCTAQPVPVPNGSLPASLQLVGPHNGEELLLATAAHVEAAVPALAR